MKTTEKILTEFLAGRQRNQWLRFSGISIYLRRSRGRCLGKGVFSTKVLDLANMEATKPGDGSWTKFIGSLKDYPDLQETFEYLFVENVLTEKFASWFRARGWIEIGESICPSFYISTERFVNDKKKRV